MRLKQDKPSWGAPKIRERLARLYPDVPMPAISTVHAVLDRHGLVKRRMRRQQQATFDGFIDGYNNARPPQALNMRYPAEHYVPSTRPYKGLPDLDYPVHDKTVTVTTCGRLCFNRQKINLSVVFAGQSVGIKQVSEHIWLVSFMDYDLGYFDHETCRLEPLDNPFGPKVLPMSPV